MGESIVRFFRGELLLGVAEIEPDKALLQIAEMIPLQPSSKPFNNLVSDPGKLKNLEF